jgi:hypothetical protein
MTFAIFGNVEKPGLKEALMVLLARLEHSGMEYALDEALAPMVAGCAGPAPTRLKSREACLEGAHMLVALGGDGTILAAARAVGRRGSTSASSASSRSWHPKSWRAPSETYSRRSTSWKSGSSSRHGAPRLRPE